MENMSQTRTAYKIKMSEETIVLSAIDKLSKLMSDAPNNMNGMSCSNRINGH